MENKDKSCANCGNRPCNFIALCITGHTKELLRWQPDSTDTYLKLSTKEKEKLIKQPKQSEQEVDTLPEMQKGRTLELRRDEHIKEVVNNSDKSELIKYFGTETRKCLQRDNEALKVFNNNLKLEIRQLKNDLENAIEQGKKLKAEEIRKAVEKLDRYYRPYDEGWEMQKDASGIWIEREEVLKLIERSM